MVFLILIKYTSSTTASGHFIVWKAQGGHQGPPKKSEIKTPKIDPIFRQSKAFLANQKPSNANQKPSTVN